MKVYHIAPGIAQNLQESLACRTGPKGMDRHSNPTHPIDVPVVLSVFDDLMAALAQQGGFGSKDRILTARLLVRIVND